MEIIDKNSLYINTCIINTVSQLFIFFNLEIYGSYILDHSYIKKKVYYILNSWHNHYCLNTIICISMHTIIINYN